jgi:segregation and condensation protein A
MLLPPDGAEEEGEGPDPRAELAARLLEYQRYKEAAGELGERRLLGRDVFPAWGLRPEPPPEGEREIEVGLFELLEAFQRVLKAAGPSGAAHEVETETITVHERMIMVMKLLELRSPIDFDDVVVAEDGRPVSRAVVVATFLAILELTRLAALRLYQSLSETGVPRGPIHLRRVEGPEGSSWKGRIAAAK